MKNLRTTATAAFATAWLMTAGLVFSRPLTVTFPDSAGADFGGRIDVSGMTLNFDNTDGTYELKIQSAVANPFRDSFQIDINVFNTGISPATKTKAFFSTILPDKTLTTPLGEIILQS